MPQARSTLVPDVPTAVRGWRQWRLELVDGRPRLVSPIRSVRWEPSTALDARCAAHPIPNEGCGCGIYAVRWVGTAALASLTPATDLVIGRVALWGEVLEGDHGWRASRAYPAELIVDPLVDDAIVNALSEDYGVPVHRCPVPLSFLHALPSAAGVRRYLVGGRARQDRVVDLLARQRAAADPEAPIEEFLRLTALLYYELRPASLARIPREVARISTQLSVVPVLWAAACAFLVAGSATRWPEAVRDLLAFGLLFGAAGVIAGLACGLGNLRTMLAVRFPRTHRVVFALAVGPVLAAWGLQAIVTLALFTGRADPVLFVVSGVVPVGVALTALTGWWFTFPTARSRHRPRPVRSGFAVGASGDPAAGV